MSTWSGGQGVTVWVSPKLKELGAAALNPEPSACSEVSSLSVPTGRNSINAHQQHKQIPSFSYFASLVSTFRFFIPLDCFFGAIIADLVESNSTEALGCWKHSWSHPLLCAPTEKELVKIHADKAELFLLYFQPLSAVFSRGASKAIKPLSCIYRCERKIPTINEG